MKQNWYGFTKISRRDASIPSEIGWAGWQSLGFSYERDPSSWYFKQLISGTKKYRTKKIPGATTLEEAKSKALDIALSLRDEPHKIVFLFSFAE